jgi:tetratricopeptide (TPR) repeat protein
LKTFSEMSPKLWETLMYMAFKYIENEEVKSHYIIASILYNSIIKVIPLDSDEKHLMNIALVQFHYGKAVQSYLSNYQLALSLLLESLSIFEKINKQDSELGLQIKYYLGNLYDDMGMVEECISVLMDVLNKQQKLYPEENSFIARTYNCLGIAEDNRGNLKPAKEFYQKAYSIFTYLSFGVETVDSVKVLNNLAGIYYKWEDYNNCIKYYTKVLEVYLNKFGQNSTNVAVTYNNLGNCFFMINDFNKALYYLKKSQEIFTKNLGNGHLQTAMCCKNLGDLYLNIEDKKNALENYLNCINTIKEKHGENHDLYITTLSKIKKLQHNKNSF